MADRPIYPKIERTHGVYETALSSWKEFNDIVHKMLDHPAYIFRGHRRDDWLLEPMLTRILKGHSNPSSARTTHLQNFKYASRGRRGNNPPPITSDREWWALGQHHGLATPLLDWTLSPYVALFFAFAEQKPNDDTMYRVVFALNLEKITQVCALLRQDPKNQNDIIEVFTPMSDENTRLVSQAALFTTSPDKVDKESWIRQHFEADSNVVLLKIYVPNSDRDECLKGLGRMNINHASLFPDLFGASMVSNMKLAIRAY